MKNQYLILIVGILWGASTAEATPICESVRGDITLDGETNIFDVQCHALYTVWELADQSFHAPICLNLEESEVDHNCDGTSNVIDLLLTIQAALHNPWGEQIDGDADGCIDTCETLVFGCADGWMNPACDTAIGNCSEFSCEGNEACYDIDGGHICAL